MNDSHVTVLPTTDLTAVTGGKGGSFSKSPAEVIQQVNQRIDVCKALDSEAKRLNPYRNRLAETRQSSIFKSAANQCWKGLYGE